ncbi:MAG: DUF2179 domain-containing protein [Phycisphaerae bacterium]|nr:DUF2179 domain-containing protein [Phycisphaerae bacterium]
MAYDYIVLPVLIFLARITDVTIGTIRVILVTRGARKLAPLLGFFEVLIWLIVVSQVMRNLSNPACYIGYAAGFATGNFFGMFLEEKLAIGMLIVRVITPQKADDLIGALNQKGFGATSIEATGANGHVNVIFSVVQRSELGKVVELIQRYYPKAFYSVEDVRFAREGIFPDREEGRKTAWHSWLLRKRK